MSVNAISITICSSSRNALIVIMLVIVVIVRISIARFGIISCVVRHAITVLDATCRVVSWLILIVEIIRHPWDVG